MNEKDKKASSIRNISENTELSMRVAKNILLQLEKLNQIEIIPRGTEESDLSRRYRNQLLLIIIKTILKQKSSSNNWKMVNDLENSLDLNNNEDFKENGKYCIEGKKENGNHKTM